MKRPQGFDRTGQRAADAFGRASGSHSPPDTPPLTAEVREPDTEPLPIVKTPISSGPAAHAPERDDVASAARTLRRARRERRRYERGEVKRFTRRTRRRRAIWLITLSSTLAVVLLAVAVAFSPLMALRTIDVVGTSRLQPAAVQKALDSQLGKPLPLIDFGVVRNELASFRLIRSYSTETHPPGTLVVRIVERQPIGLLKSSAGFALVDQAGVVISSSADRPGGYPVIEVPEDAGSAATTAGFRAATSVLSALPASVLPLVQTVSAKTTDDVALTLADGKTVVWGSPDHSALKAADLTALLTSAPDASSYDVSSPQSPVIK